MTLGLRQPDITETPKNHLILEKILIKNTQTSPLAGRKHPRITLTAEDNDRLSSLVRAAMDKMPEIASCLADELDRATVLPKGRVADDAVRMGSHLEYRDETLGTVRTATLVYPDEADISQGKISVLTPIGIALIGLKAGQSITWETRNGVVRELTLLGVRQPQYA
jgi:regulator of nucleoside diphosphate kinase